MRRVLVLASASPRRERLLAWLGVPFAIDPASVDESPLAGERATDMVHRLARAKGREHAGQQPQFDGDDSSRTNQPNPNDGKALQRYDEQYRYDEVGNLLALVHDWTLVTRNASDVATTGARLLDPFTG